jgi:hypothetical protein
VLDAIAIAAVILSMVLLKDTNAQELWGLDANAQERERCGL